MSHVPLHLDLLGATLDKYQRFLLRVGNLESKLLTYDIQDLKVEKPIFIAGLARSGSTILLEILAEHNDVASHQYRDYPFVHFHYFWSIMTAPFYIGAKKVERGHKDGLKVNAKSPEALDEILWMSFFEQLHNSDQNNILNAQNRNKDFDRFYTNNILKTLYGRKSSRFISKNNYNVTRLQYLKDLFPDLQILIPVRRPEEHVYSLLKQNRLFRKEQDGDLRSQRYTRRMGHHEFGLDFRPINTNNPDAVKHIMELWEQENFVEAYALYWSEIYAHLWRESEALGDCVKIVRYDDLCTNPAESITDLLKFCDLPEDENVSAWASQIKKPGYYTPDLSDEEIKRIHDITKDTAKLYWAKDQ